MAINIKELYIDSFRGFKDFRISLNKNITCISGHNGVGKSTILAILSNCGELRDYRTLMDSSFTGEFTKLIIGDENYDNEESTIDIFFDGLSEDGHQIDKISFRKTFQRQSGQIKGYKRLKRNLSNKLKELWSEDNSENEVLPVLYYKADISEKNMRFRLIPKKQHGVREHEGKVQWPTLYLGLSRLYPIGEIEEKLDYHVLASDFDTEILEKHKYIMSSNDEYREVEKSNIASVKNSTSIKSDSYPSTANSSGQDNLGQILTSIYSFEKLKSDYPDYQGGLIVIDELDASLHPAAQNKLVNFLIGKSIELDLQIVFTTHSLSLLEHIESIKTLQNRSAYIDTRYITKDTGNIEVRENPSKRYLKNDLTQRLEPTSVKKIPIITEDSVARWYLERIIDFYNRNNSDTRIDLNRVRFVDGDLGWSNIIGLVKGDYDYFKNYIIVFDTDLNGTAKGNVSEQFRGSRFINTNSQDTYFILPTIEEYRNFNIERLIWEFLNSLEIDDEFYLTDFARNQGITKKIISDNGINSERYNRLVEKKKYKEWFEDYRYIAEEVLPFFFERNKQIIMQFGARLERYYKNLL
ncbi:AAA family ATPase [Streptococcus suis]|nr:AAA family ATPase [Streptococcus suis]NQO44610.1 AAA family ATPase [Streptococcus suis]NQO55248.1 AAA family ATPase [Streptococcus suis]